MYYLARGPHKEYRENFWNNLYLTSGLLTHLMHFHEFSPIILVYSCSQKYTLPVNVDSLTHGSGLDRFSTTVVQIEMCDAVFGLMKKVIMLSPCLHSPRVVTFFFLVAPKHTKHTQNIIHYRT